MSSDRHRRHRHRHKHRHKKGRDDGGSSSGGSSSASSPSPPPEPIANPYVRIVARQLVGDNYVKCKARVKIGCSTIQLKTLISDGLGGRPPPSGMTLLCRDIEITNSKPLSRVLDQLPEVQKLRAVPLEVKGDSGLKWVDDGEDSSSDSMELSSGDDDDEAGGVFGLSEAQKAKLKRRRQREREREREQQLQLQQQQQQREQKQRERELRRREREKQRQRQQEMMLEDDDDILGGRDGRRDRDRGDRDRDRRRGGSGGGLDDYDALDELTNPSSSSSRRHRGEDRDRDRYGGARDRDRDRDREERDKKHELLTEQLLLLHERSQEMEQQVKTLSQENRALKTKILEDTEYRREREKEYGAEIERLKSERARLIEALAESKEKNVRMSDSLVATEATAEKAERKASALESKLIETVGGYRDAQVALKKQEKILRASSATRLAMLDLVKPEMGQFSCISTREFLSVRFRFISVFRGRLCPSCGELLVHRQMDELDCKRMRCRGCGTAVCLVCLAVNEDLPGPDGDILDAVWRGTCGDPFSDCGLVSKQTRDPRRD